MYKIKFNNQSIYLLDEKYISTDEIINKVSDNIIFISKQEVSYPKIKYYNNEYSTTLKRIEINGQLYKLESFINNNINLYDNTNRIYYLSTISDYIKLIVTTIYSIHQYLYKNKKMDISKPNIPNYINILLDKSIETEEYKNYINMLDNLTDDNKYCEIMSSYLFSEFNRIYKYLNKLTELIKSLMNTNDNFTIKGLNSFSVGITDKYINYMKTSINKYYYDIKETYENILSSIMNLSLLNKIVKLTDQSKPIVVQSNITQIIFVMYYLIKKFEYKLTNIKFGTNISLDLINKYVNSGDYEIYIASLFNSKIEYSFDDKFI